MVVSSTISNRENDFQFSPSNAHMWCTIALQWMGVQANDSHSVLYRENIESMVSDARHLSSVTYVSVDRYNGVLSRPIHTFQDVPASEKK
jgi:hypothetical protein